MFMSIELIIDLVFKIKDGYKLELQTPETMKLIGSTKKLIDKTKNGEKVPNLEGVEVVLFQCNLVDNQYQQNSDVLQTFTQNKSYAYLLNVEPNNLVFLKTYNTDEIIITFTDQNGRLLEIEDKVNLTLLINKQKCDDILLNQELENLLKDMDFYHMLENIKNNYWIQDEIL